MGSIGTERKIVIVPIPGEVPVPEAPAPQQEPVTEPAPQEPVKTG
jgi:hypothetical protein